MPIERMLRSGFVTCIDCNADVEERKKFTVAPSFNKGGYTVHHPKTARKAAKSFGKKGE